MQGGRGKSKKFESSMQTGLSVVQNKGEDILKIIQSLFKILGISNLINSL